MHQSLKPLAPGQYVVLQNQHGNQPLRWDRSGVVVECRPYDQYVIRVHGSNRLTLRNRKFLRCYDPPDSVGKQIVLSPYETTNTLNKGAGKSVSVSENVQDTVPDKEPQALITNQEDDSIAIPNHISGENIIETSPVKPVPVRSNVTESVVPPRSNVIQSETPLRRSSRQNKGETKKFDDYVTGEDLKKL